MEIQPTETVISGKWIFTNDWILGDDVSQRIHLLVEEYLIEVARDEGGWIVLYRDPSDDRLWELTYPNAQMQGSGPRQLTCLSNEEARQKYKLP